MRVHEEEQKEFVLGVCRPVDPHLLPSGSSKKQKKQETDADVDYMETIREGAFNLVKKTLIMVGMR